MASKACKVSSWRGSGAKHAIANASVSHWPFVCRPHEAGQGWGGLNHLFGGRSFREVMGWVGGIRALRFLFCALTSRMNRAQLRSDVKMISTTYSRSKLI